MRPPSVPLPPQPASQPGEKGFDLARTRAELVDRFLLNLLILLPLFIGLRFLAFRGTGPWPVRLFCLPAMYLGFVGLHLARRRVPYPIRVHVLLAISLAFWVQQVFLVGPMELGTISLALAVPLAAGLLVSPRAGWCYLWGLSGLFLMGAVLDGRGLIPPYPHTQGWERRRLWDFWLAAALGLPMLVGAFLAAIRRLFQAWAGLVAGLEREMADRARLQEQLLQSQKLESIGRLAGGVAHDMNNMITAVLGHAHLMENGLPPGTPLREHLDGIHQAGLRSSGIVRQLLIFTRQQPTRPEVVDLNAHIEQTRNLLAPLVGADIDLRFRAGTGLWKVAIDPAHLDQVLLNLVVNARDAMPGGGHLTLATANIRITAADCLGQAFNAPGPHVRLSVSDEGTGMAPETLRRIFEPFFTTKEPGKGTGLGLATVFGIVRQAGGSIDVCTELGLGTTFKVYLPACPRPEAQAQNGTTTARGAARGGTILVVEDDEPLRRIIPALVQSLGYQVRLAGSPAEALDICARPEVALDLLLIDLVMPDMNGQALFQAAQVLRPGIRALFMSGYAPGSSGRAGFGEGLPFLQKPFTAEDLARMLAQVLQP